MIQLPIADVDIFGVTIPLAGDGFRNAYATAKVQHSIIVRIRTVDGLSGLGNVDPLPGYSSETVEESLSALRKYLAPALVGTDAGNIHAILATMDRTVTGFLDAKAAVEMACVDVLSRTLGIPVHQFLGGAVVDKVKLNGWIGILSPEQAADEAAVWLKNGFLSAKIKLGSGIQADVDRVRAVREAVGSQMQLRVDANGNYSVADSIALGRLLEPFDLQLLEQPVAANDLPGLAKVRQAISIPVMADEAVTDHESLIDVIRGNCADIVKLKVMKQGGLLRCQRMLSTATAAGLKVVIGHGFGMAVNTMAEVMLAATSDNVIAGLECVGPLKMLDDVVQYRPDLSSGCLLLPHKPGLGVELDEEKLARYANASSVA